MIDRLLQPADDDNTEAQRRRLIWTLAGVGLLVLVLFLVISLLACVFWVPRRLYPPLTETELQGVSDAASVQELKGARLKLQNDARTTLLQGLGAVLLLTGAGIGAAVTLRQVRVSQGQLQATRKQMQHTLEATQQQLNLTEQGQVTDRYIRAVEQLGHEKAPVRLGALYSLERLAQDNPEYRQTVVDVFCAYLRMPSPLPARTELEVEHVEQMAPPANGRDRAPHPAPGRDPALEELQVRRTAQRLLADHLRCPPRTSGQDAQLLPPSPQQAFWPGISLDLTGATLVDFTFAQVSVIQAQFVGTTFQGTAAFDRVTFQGDAWFTEVTFQGDALFALATFQSDAGFDRVTFRGDALFDGASFQRPAWFEMATFRSEARFDRVTFQGDAWFTEASFQGPAWFAEATFEGDARFKRVTFHGDAWFTAATFQGGADFGRATLRDSASFSELYLEHLDDPRINERQTWPDGWAIRRDPADPTRGTLVRAEYAEGAQAGGPPSDPTDSGSGTD